MGEYGVTIDVESPAFRLLSDDARNLQQALTLRLETRRGTYWDDPDYGTLVDDYLNAGLTSDAIQRVAAEIRAECEKDERVASAAVVPTVKLTAGGYELRPEITVFPASGVKFDFVGPLWSFTGADLRRGA